MHIALSAAAVHDCQSVAAVRKEKMCSCKSVVAGSPTCSVGDAWSILYAERVVSGSVVAFCTECWIRLQSIPPGWCLLLSYVHDDCATVVFTVCWRDCCRWGDLGGQPVASTRVTSIPPAATGNHQSIYCLICWSIMIVVVV